MVYFANYLRICERSWFKYLKQRGWDLSEKAKEGVLLTVKRVEAEYFSPARYGMTLDIETKVETLTRASLWFYHRITDHSNQVLFAEVRNQMVAVSLSGKLLRLPSDLMKILTA